MKTILIVDDEPRLLKSIEAGLDIHRDSFSVLTAANGIEAADLLAQQSVDLVITDLKMPEMDGFELLAHISSHFPMLPAIVMTAFSTPDIERDIEGTNNLKLLEKPIDFDELASAIFETLERTAEEGSLTGISLASFLQLLETEQKTCLIEVKSGNEKGFIYFNNGELYAAVFDDQKGEEAVYAMLMFDEVEIRIKKHIKKKFKKTVGTPLLPMLMEGMRRKDENKPESSNTEDNGQEKAAPDAVAFDSDGDDGAVPEQQENTNENEVTKAVPISDILQKGELDMSKLEETLAKMAEVDGFMAVGIFTPNGEMAAQHNNSGLKLEEIGSMANDVLLKAQKATDMMDVGRGQLVHIEAPKAHVLARCLNENTDFSITEAGKAHLHMVILLAKDGNLAMTKMKLTSIIQEVAPAFR